MRDTRSASECHVVLLKAGLDHGPRDSVEGLADQIVAIAYLVVLS